MDEIPPGVLTTHPALDGWLCAWLAEQDARKARTTALVSDFRIANGCSNETSRRVVGGRLLGALDARPTRVDLAFNRQAGDGA